MGRLGQIKIQEMSFVLLAIVIFFAIAFLLYFAISFSGLKKDVVSGEQDKAKEIIQNLALSPELSFDPERCITCIDLDKTMILKNKSEYRNFWGLDYLRIERVYPRYENGECNFGIYPNCDSITLVKLNDSIGTPPFVFASLCRYEMEKEGYVKCQLGKIYASGRIGAVR